jgi:phospholipid/cholesterol/gamma-HCH transport system substrate-binding protein
VSRSPGRDLLVGLFVLAGLAAIAYLSFAVGGLTFNDKGGLTVTADFDEIAGLKPRSQVVISGVKVGQVTSIVLDEGSRAKVTMDLDQSLKLPSDTSASIVTAGLLGDRYISLQPGGDDKILKSGDQISFTESAVILERLIGKFVHNSDVGKSE